MKKLALYLPIILILTLTLALLLVGCGGPFYSPCEHTVKTEWEFDRYYHYHATDCGRYKHRQDVALHEGDRCFCGFDKSSFEEETPDESGSEDLGEIKLKSDGTLKFNKVKGAFKYVVTVTPPAGQSTITVDLVPSKTQIKLDTLTDNGFPIGKSTVTFQAWEYEEIEIDGEVIKEEVPMTGAKESFIVFKLNGEYTLRPLTYSDEYIKLDEYYPKTEGDTTVYIHELMLKNNEPTKYNPTKTLTLASGITYKAYKTSEARQTNNNDEAYGEFDLNAFSVKHGENYVYIRTLDADGNTQDYDLCVLGLYTVEITRYNLGISGVSEYGVYTTNPTKIGQTITVNEGDVITKDTLFDGVADGFVARDEEFNTIFYGDYMLEYAYSKKISLYFYDEDTVVADCDEYKEYAESLGAYSVAGAINISIFDNSFDGEDLYLPYSIGGIAVNSVSISFNNNIKRIYFAEGYTGFPLSVMSCGGIEEIYLPSTITYINDFAFKDISTSATINCAFTYEYSQRFSEKWNRINGSMSNYTTVYEKTYTQPTTQAQAGGLIYSLSGGELTVIGATNRFRGVIPNEAEYEGVSYPVTAIAELPMCKDLVISIGKNIKRIDGEAFFGQVKGIVLDEENTEFVYENNSLYNKDKTRLITTVAGQAYYFIPSSVTTLDYYSLVSVDTLISWVIDGKYVRDSFVVFYGGSDSSFSEMENRKDGNNRTGKNNTFFFNHYSALYEKLSYHYENGVEYLLTTNSDYSGCNNNASGIIECYCQKNSCDAHAIVFRIVEEKESLDISVANGLPVLGFWSYSEETINYNYIDELELFYLPDTVKNLTVQAGMPVFKAYGGNSGYKYFFNHENIESITFVGDGDVHKFLLNEGFSSDPKHAFPNLSAIYVTDSTMYSAEGGILYNAAKTELIYVPYALSGDVVIPEGVTSIGQTSSYYNEDIHIDFAGCKNITSIKLPSTLKDIGMLAFFECFSLKKVEFTGPVERIFIGAFNACISLEEFTLPEIDNPNNLCVHEDYRYPVGASSIFAYCGKLTALRFNGTIEEFKAKFNYEKKDEAAFDAAYYDSYILTIICSDGEYDITNA